MMDNTSTKNIEIGKFYLIHDGSKTGHPGYVSKQKPKKSPSLTK